MEHLIRRHRTLAAGLLVVMLLTATACAVGPLAGLFPQAASVPAANPSAASVAPAPAAPSAPSAPATAPRAASKDFALVTEVWNVLQQDYVERNRLDSEKLTQGAVRGMIEALNDPYTAYIDPNSFRVDQESLRGSFEGIGAVVAVREGQVAKAREIVLAGELIAERGGTPEPAQRLTAGQIFGAGSLIGAVHATATLRASRRTWTLALPHERVERLEREVVDDDQLDA